jgi:hypothetical protein
MSISDERSKIERLLVLALSSEQVNEALAARSALKNTLASEGLDIHELAARVCGRKLSKAEMQKIYDAGYQEGKDAAATTQGFGSTEGPTYYEMALFCEERSGHLSGKEQGFISDMVRWCARREPTEKQAKWLHVLWVRLGRRR